MAQVIAREWALPPAEAPLPLHVQVADERYHVVERMMRRRVASLPDGRVDDAPSQVGDDGVRLSRYVRWVKEQLEARAPDGYHPTLHFDVQGALGDVFRGNLGRVLGQLYGMEFAAKPYPVRVEDPVIEADRATQIEQLRTLRGYVHSRRMQARIVADHWVNTLEDVQAFVEAEAADALHLRPADLGGVHHAVEAVLACHAGNVAVLLGGSATTTDLAAQVRTHVALATRADLLLAGPGRDVDGAVAGTRNEMARALALMARRPVEGA
jgi:methylaspartate ammonia-lyase